MVYTGFNEYSSAWADVQGDAKAVVRDLGDLCDLGVEDAWIVIEELAEREIYTANYS